MYEREIVNVRERKRQGSSVTDRESEREDKSLPDCVTLTSVDRKRRERSGRVKSTPDISTGSVNSVIIIFNVMFKRYG